jgi:plastocyanin
MRAIHALPFLCATLAAGVLGCSSSTSPSLPSGDVTIVMNAGTMTTTAFNPNPFSESFAARAKVVWVNGDVTGSGYGMATGTSHHIVSNTGLFDSGVLTAGSSYTFTFAGPGTYAYHCSIHPGMVGSITISP